MPRNTDPVEVEAKAQNETDDAFLLYDGSITKWVPKSKVTDNGDGTFTMPEWLAMEKGFI